MDGMSCATEEVKRCRDIKRICIKRTNKKRGRGRIEAVQMRSGRGDRNDIWGGPIVGGIEE